MRSQSDLPSHLEIIHTFILNQTTSQSKKRIYTKKTYKIQYKNTLQYTKEKYKIHKRNNPVYTKETFEIYTIK